MLCYIWVDLAFQAHCGISQRSYKGVLHTGSLTLPVWSTEDNYRYIS